MAVGARFGSGHHFDHRLEEGDVGERFGRFRLENCFACSLHDVHCRVEHAVGVCCFVAPVAQIKVVSVAFYAGEEDRVADLLLVLLVEAKRLEEDLDQ